MKFLSGIRAMCITPYFEHGLYQSMRSADARVAASTVCWSHAVKTITYILVLTPHLGQLYPALAATHNVALIIHHVLPLHANDNWVLQHPPSLKHRHNQIAFLLLFFCFSNLQAIELATFL